MSQVILYARLSVTTEESVSIDRQLSAGRKYASARGWTVVAEYVDDGVSASKVRPELRPGWRQVLGHEGDFAAVIVWKVDRLARRVLDFLNADQALQARGAGIVAVEDPVDMTNAQGKAFATMLAVFAELEAASISARVAGARRALLTVGRRAGGRPPYGWKNRENPSGPGFVLAQDELLIPVVLELVTKAMAGNSLYSLARWMDENAPARAHKNRHMDGWSTASVDAILRNPVLAGMTPYQPGRKPGEAADPWAVLRDESGLPVIDDEVAVLTTDERRALLATLDAAKRPGSRPHQGAASSSLLSGVVHCALCNRRMYRATAGGQRSYRCQTRRCPGGSINQEKLEAEVVGRLLAERGDCLTWEVVPAEVDISRLTDVEDALLAATSELARLDDSKREAELLVQIRELKDVRAQARAQFASSAGILELGTSVAEAWGDEEKRRATLVGQLVDGRVHISPGKKGGRFDPTRIQFSWVELPDDSVPVDKVPFDYRG